MLSKILSEFLCKESAADCDYSKMKFKFEIQATEESNFSLPLALACDGETVVMAIYHFGEYDVNYDPLIEWFIRAQGEELQLATIYKWHSGLLYSCDCGTASRGKLLTLPEALKMEKQFLQELVEKGYFVKDRNQLVWTLKPTPIAVQSRL